MSSQTGRGDMMAADAALQAVAGIADELAVDVLAEVALDSAAPADVRQQAADTIVALGEQNPGLQVVVPDGKANLFDEVMAGRVPAPIPGNMAEARLAEPPPAPAEAEPAPLLPSFEANLGDLDVDLDDEPLDADEIAAYSLEEDEPAVYEADPGEWQDPDDLQRRLVAAEKQLAHHKGLRAKDNQKRWREEATRRFPLAEPYLDTIRAESRRGYLKAALEHHQRLQPFIEQKVLGPVQAHLQGAREQARAEAQAAWGVPQAGPAVTETQNTQPTAEQRAAKAKDFQGWVREMMSEIPI